MTAARAVEWEAWWQTRGGGVQPGEHVSVFGPTGSGKTRALIWMCETYPDDSVLVVTKGRDSVIRRLVRERGWQLAHDPDDILTAAGKPGRLLRRSAADRWERRPRPRQRIVYQPAVTADGVRGRAEQLEPLVETIIDRAYSHCRAASADNMMVAVDETMYAAMELHQAGPLVTVWNEGRSLGLSLAAGMQRPSWVPRSSKSAPSYLLIFDTVDPEDLRELAGMVGVTPSVLRDMLDRLPPHHHLLIATRDRPRAAVQSRVVIRPVEPAAHDR